MSIFREVCARQTRPFSRPGDPSTPGSLRWLWKEMQCHYQDQVVIHGREEHEVPAFSCKFNVDGLCGHLLAVADEGGSIRLMDTRKLLSDPASLVSEIVCFKNAIFDLSWVSGGSKLLTASGTSSVDLWDVVGGACLGSFRHHTGSVKSVHSKKDEPSMFVSSCRDGKICVWDTRCSSRASGHCPVNTICAVNSITAVLFHGDGKIASAGSGDGSVKLWDMRKHYSSSKKAPTAWLSFEAVQSLSGGKAFGFSSLVADSHETFLYASCTNHIIYKYHSAGLLKKPIGAFGGCTVSSFYVKSGLSPDNKFLISGSSCGKGFMWEVDHPEAPPLVLPSNSAEVTAVDWCPSMDKLATCSDECDLSVWRVRRGERSQHSWGVTRCEEYTGEGHLRAKEVLRPNPSPSPPPPPPTQAGRPPLNPLNATDLVPEPGHKVVRKRQYGGGGASGRGTKRSRSKSVGQKATHVVRTSTSPLNNTISSYFKKST